MGGNLIVVLICISLTGFVIVFYIAILLHFYSYFSDGFCQSFYIVILLHFSENICISLDDLLIGLFSLLSSLYMLDINLLSDVELAKNFPHPVTFFSN